MNTSPIEFNNDSVCLNSPTQMPNASSFLWNSAMMIQVNCRGYATAQFMQPEPAKYTHAPNLEAKSFMQPEQPYYAHHPGRFFYIKDELSGELFSLPYEPVRSNFDTFRFIAKPDSISWQITISNLIIDITLGLAIDRPLELWQISVKNLSQELRKLSIYSYFPIGYMSWMNQSANYDPDLQAVIAASITPYQKYQDYFKQQDYKDQTFLLADRRPDSWEARQDAFEGEGGLTAPSSIAEPRLSNSIAEYEMPTAVMQHRVSLAAQQTDTLKFVFGPARDIKEIAQIRTEFILQESAFDRAKRQCQDYLQQTSSSLTIQTPDKEFDNFVNQWLPRQMFYHGDVSRLTTDPQTRNYLQDTMGLSYLKPSKARANFIFALAQQQHNGAMPDGILLTEDAELKYINQVPHSDHCVWLPVCLSAYLDETNDIDILQEQVPFADHDELVSVFEHICRSMEYLLSQRDECGLNYIEQGDWCDPMNMVGYKGVGVSAWLTLATSYALTKWAEICNEINELDRANDFRQHADQLNIAANKYFWHKAWYGRGITDAGRLFGIEDDQQGRIFLNPQAWAILSGAADQAKQKLIINQIAKQLETPYGVAMLAPAYTEMREDIGRVTQKFPGTAENGSIYNHAATFYIYALYSIGQTDQAFKMLRQMIPGPDQEDLLQRGQLPVFIPNYYRGAYHQFPRTAGRSSQLFNTGSVHWFYRCLIDGLFGIHGVGACLRFDPKLPSHWPQASLTREFRGSFFDIEIKRDKATKQTQLSLDGDLQNDLSITDFEVGKTYSVIITIPTT